jgi:hypothetical protein
MVTLQEERDQKGPVHKRVLVLLTLLTSFLPHACTTLVTFGNIAIIIQGFAAAGSF